MSRTSLLKIVNYWPVGGWFKKRNWDNANHSYAPITPLTQALKPFSGEIFRMSALTVSVVRIHQAPVVQTLDSAIHRINHYPAESLIEFRNTYPLDSDLSGGYGYPTFKQPGRAVSFCWLAIFSKSRNKLVLNPVIPSHSIQSNTKLNFVSLNSTYHRHSVPRRLCKTSSLSSRKPRMQIIPMLSRLQMRAMSVRLR